MHENDKNDIKIRIKVIVITNSNVIIVYSKNENFSAPNTKIENILFKMKLPRNTVHYKDTFNHLIAQNIAKTTEIYGDNGLNDIKEEEQL